jgi:hypothetical protein
MWFCQYRLFQRRIRGTKRNKGKRLHSNQPFPGTAIKEAVRTSQRTFCVSDRQISQQILFKDTTAVYRKSHGKINILYVQNTERINYVTGGIHSYHCQLRVFRWNKIRSDKICLAAWDEFLAFYTTTRFTNVLTRGASLNLNASKINPIDNSF